MVGLDDRDRPPIEKGSNPLGALARIYWMLGGYVILAFGAATIARSKPALGPGDVVYWIVVASLVAVRYLDVARLGGTTAEGAPATLRHWWRYAAVVAAASAAAWVGAHGVALLPGR